MTISKLKLLRVEKGLTQTDLAKLLGVGQGAVSSWERGVSYPSPYTMQQLEDLFGVKKEELFFEAFHNSNL